MDVKQLDKYQDAAWDLALEQSRTWQYLFPGLVSEVGELAELYAKGVRDGFPRDLDKHVKNELGDILWFIACLGRYCGFRLGDIAQANIEKLRSRRDRGVLQGSGDER